MLASPVYPTSLIFETDLKWCLRKWITSNQATTQTLATWTALLCDWTTAGPSQPHWLERSVTGILVYLTFSSVDYMTATLDLADMLNITSLLGAYYPEPAPPATLTLFTGALALLTWRFLLSQHRFCYTLLFGLGTNPCVQRITLRLTTGG